MRRSHLESLRPVCPHCKLHEAGENPLKLAWASAERDGHVVEGALQCSHEGCQLEYPILDGIPILVPDARSFIASHYVEFAARDDLSHEMDSMLAECSGFGSVLDVMRQHLSQYAWDHYGELDPLAADEPARPGEIARAFGTVFDHEAVGDPAPPVLDAGCAVGRGTFELAERCDGLVLGLDLNFSMLRLASRALREGVVRYPLRRVGMIYDRREFPIRFDGAQRVDFWLADAAVLPLPAATFATSVAFNLLDCVPSPLDLLRSLRAGTRPAGRMIVGSPYDWSGAVTATESWIGGHSPRATGEGRSEPLLRALLEPGAHPVSLEGVRRIAEWEDLPWHVRLHDRSVNRYSVHVVAAEVVGDAAVTD